MTDYWFFSIENSWKNTTFINIGFLTTLVQTLNEPNILKTPDLNTFARVDQLEWKKAAKDQLKGLDPFSELMWSTLSLNNLKPYYDILDISDLENQVVFFQGLESHRWKLYQRVEVNNENSANEETLEALEGGCDGIIFETSNGDVDYDHLLKNINKAICDISTKKPLENAHGMNENNCLFAENTNGPVNQITSILTNITPKHQWIHRNAFPDFFAEISSIRALRYLLAAEKDTPQIKIHSKVPPHESNEHQWFLNTTAGLASILGGSHSIDLHTSIGEKRISRNVGNLIREESGIDQYEDQCGGSYLVESLTNHIIQAVKAN